jgi:hypothetical protein
VSAALVGAVAWLGGVALAMLAVAIGVVVDAVVDVGEPVTVTVAGPAVVVCCGLVEHPVTAKVAAAVANSVSFDIERAMAVLRRAMMSESRLR